MSPMQMSPYVWSILMTARVPLTDNPNRMASFRAAESSNNIRSGCNSTPQAMAAASPFPNRWLNLLTKDVNEGCLT